jgi:hypothetical protein
MDVDDMVAMMCLLDTDGSGDVTKAEFGVYYKRLKSCDDEAFELAWRKIDANSDGVLSVDELCDYFGVPRSECATKLKEQQRMSDDQILEALQLQSLLNEARAKAQQQQRAHAERLRNLAALAAEMDEQEDVDEDETTSKVASPTLTTKLKAKHFTEASPLTLQDLIRHSKRRGELAAHHYDQG